MQGVHRVIKHARSLQLLAQSLNKWLPSVYVRVYGFFVYNIMATCFMGCRIDIIRLSARYGGDSSPKHHSLGYKYRGKVRGKSVCFIIFAHGMMSATGIQSEEDVSYVEAHGRELVRPYLIQ